MSKVIVTGGSGFIGTNLVEFYLSAGHEVFNLDILPPRNLNHIAHWYKVDIADKEALSSLIKEIKPSLIFHFAARTDLDGKDLKSYSANIEGVSNIIEAINKINTVKFIIFASSMLVCRLGYQPNNSNDYCPDTVYGESKVIGERIVRESSLTVPWTIVRPTSIWGPWFDIPYRSFFDTVHKGLYFHPSGLRVKRSYGFVLNVIYQLDRIADQFNNTLIGETIYLADYKPIDLKSWAVLIQEKLGVRKIKEVPHWLFRISALIGDFFIFMGMKNPPMSSFRFKNMCTETILNTDKLEEYVGKCPYSVEQGVELTCEWLIDQEKNNSKINT